MEKFMKSNFTVTEIALSGYVELGSGIRFHKDRANHGLVINLGEKKDYVFDGGYTVTVGQNEIIYLPKGSTYSIRAAVTGKSYFINFELDTTQSCKPFVFKTKNPARYIKEFKSAESLHTNKKISYEMQEKAALYRIMSMMQTEYESKYLSTATEKIIEPAIKYIHENYRKSNITTDFLAKLCLISEDYLRKIFRNVYGMPPIKYINQLKIYYAKELILSGMYSVSEAAQLSGYADISYFSREFRKYFDISPAQMKKAQSR